MEEIKIASFDEAKKYMASMPFVDDVEQLKQVLEACLHLSDSSKALEYILEGNMPSKIGNLKIGEDTLIINVNHALNCYSDKMGYCEHCKDCYAKKAPCTYKNSFLYGFASEIQFNKLATDKIILSVETQFKKELKSNEIKFIRFNEAGDFKSFKVFKKANDVAKHFFNKYGIISYSYTHNKELKDHKEAIKNSYIIINWSFNIDNEYKQAITCNKLEDLVKYYNDDNYIICTGKCYHCSYCKDKNDLRTVVFVNHYKDTIEAGLKAGLSLNQLKELEAQKFIDYGLFLRSLI
mgnify:CR=1 FL=1